MSPEKIDQEFLNSGYGVTKSVIYDQSTVFAGELPAIKMHDPHVGIFISAPPVNFVMYRSKADAPFFDRFLIDSNGDDRLIDEQPVALPDIAKTVPLRLIINGVSADMDLRFTPLGPKLLPRHWAEGITLINNQPTKIAVMKQKEGLPYGTANNDVLLVDLNLNGKFDLNFDPAHTEAFLLNKRLSVGGKIYDASISEDGGLLTFSEFTGASGTLTLNLPPNPKKKIEYFSFTLLPENASGSAALKVITKSLPIRLPVGKYSLIKAMIVGDNDRRLLKYAYPEFTVTDGSEKTIDLSGASMKAVFKEEDGKLIAAQKTFGVKGAGTIYEVIGALNKGMAGPDLLIYETANPTNVFYRGNLEYG